MTDAKLKPADPEELTKYGQDLHDELRFLLVERFKIQKVKCYEHHNKMAEDYARCMYSLKKGMKDESRKMKFKSIFVKLKLQSCVNKTPEEQSKCFQECKSLGSSILESAGTL